MKILFVCHEFPIGAFATTVPVLNSLKYLSGKFGHDITLVAPKVQGKDYPDLNPYCRTETVAIPVWPGLKSPRAILLALKNILGGGRSLLGFAYSTGLSKKVDALLDNNRFDVLVLDHPTMLPYVSNAKVPVVLLEVFEQSEIALMQYKLEKHWLKKLFRLLYYYQTINYARTYQRATISIAVSSHQRDVVLSHCPNLDIVVIPTGIDTDYFKIIEPEAPVPSLIITGSMDNPENQKMVLDFYYQKYPLIKMKVPQLRLYIVGKSPGKKLLQLTEDESVIVTGYVDDLRPYLSRAWAVIAPLQEGFGIKHRLQQAMTVGKPVVATSMAVKGINVTPGENVIIADNTEEFVNKVVELLIDRQMRERIGAGARQLMVANYNREKASDKLNEVLERAARTPRA